LSIIDGGFVQDANIEQSQIVYVKNYPSKGKKVEVEVEVDISALKSSLIK